LSSCGYNALRVSEVPTEYSPQLAETICSQLATGDKTLRQICRELGIPHSTVLTWASKHTPYPEFPDQYTRARDIGCDAEFDGIMDGYAIEPPTVDGKVDQGWVAWNRDRQNDRKWCLARRKPAAYGEKVQQEVTGNIGVTGLAEILSQARKR
jgi:hypothetical protein